MTLSNTRQAFLRSEKAVQLRAELVSMVESPKYNTHSPYSTGDTDKYLFVEKRMEYMSRYPAMDHWQYLLNLKLMTTIK